MQIAIADVAVTDYSTSEVVDPVLRLENDILKVFTFERNIELESQAIVRCGH